MIDNLFLLGFPIYILMASGFVYFTINHERAIKVEAAEWDEARRQYTSYDDKP